MCRLMVLSMMRKSATTSRAKSQIAASATRAARAVGRTGPRLAAGFPVACTEDVTGFLPPAVRIDKGTRPRLWGVARLLVAKRATGHIAERAEQSRELQREDELRRRAGPQRLQRLQVLQRHRLAVHGLRHREDRVQRQGEALGAEDGGLAVALGAEDRRLFVALGDGDSGLALPVGLCDHRAAAALRGHLPGHLLLHFPPRQNFSYLDGGDL